MDVKINFNSNLSSNTAGFNKNVSPLRAGNLNAAAINLKSRNLGGEGDKLGFTNAVNLANLNEGGAAQTANLKISDDGESSADILKKQLEKLQKRLKELEAAIKRANADKNPYAKELAASLETQKGAVFARIMQISAQILQMQTGGGKI